MLTWRTPLRDANGYAISADAIVRALRREGVPATLIDLADRRAIPTHSVTYAPGDAFPGRGIGFTMTEVDGFPRDWVRRSNRMTEIWTPTDFNRRALVACGVKRPAYVIPLGIDPEQFHPGVARVPNPRGDYVFVSNFEWSERKNPELLLRTFNRTFRCQERVLLVCKINHRDRGIHAPNAIRALGLDERGGRIYFIFNRAIPHRELASLYRSADCFVSTSRGEGWGLPPLEAMACGLPVIATDWSGHTTFLDPSDSYPLRVRSLIPAMPSYPYYSGFRWAEPDEEHLSLLLRHVFEHQDEARERGLRASARVRATFTWKETARRIKERLECGRPG